MSDSLPRVQQAIEKSLQKRGLDAKSREHFVDLIWRYAESEKPADERRQLAALRILGKAFISEKIEVDKPQQLKIGGIEEGLEKMGLGEEVLREAGFLEQ